MLFQKKYYPAEEPLSTSPPPFIGEEVFEKTPPAASRAIETKDLGTFPQNLGTTTRKRPLLCYPIPGEEGDDEEEDEVRPQPENVAPEAEQDQMDDGINQK